MGKEVVATKKAEEDYSIKPQAVTPSLDTSNWPLLLKNYDKRESMAPEKCAISDQGMFC